MKYGFLFGAGAETAYKLPLGGRFALEIFRQDTIEPKNDFKMMRQNVNATSSYAADWLPNDYINKNINIFGKSVFQNIICSTVEHKRNIIIEKINNLDEIADKIVKRMTDNAIDIDTAFKDLLGTEVTNVRFNQIFKFNEALKEGNKIFESNYYSSLIKIYRDKPDEPMRVMLSKIILAIMQLHLGALSENLTRNINDNLFEKKDDNVDLCDDIGNLIKLNYSSAGVSGLEFLFDKPQIDIKKSYGIVLKFAYLLIEEIYSSVLDYKSLIDSHWHYLYNPSSDWAKFCKISIFLLTVRRYIMELGDKAISDNPNGYYNMLKTALDKKYYDASTIATTNYNIIIENILGNNYPITHLNGSVDMWYDPYLNKVGKQQDLENHEKHIIVPLIFTQSGTKPMTSINMSAQYVEMYNNWKNSDAIVVVGYGFGSDDEHINGILRTLVNDDDKRLIVVTLSSDKTIQEKRKNIAKKLKIRELNKIRLIMVNNDGKVENMPWTEVLKTIE